MVNEIKWPGFLFFLENSFHSDVYTYTGYSHKRKYTKHLCACIAMELQDVLFLVILNHGNGLLIHFDPDQLLLYIVIYLPNPFILQFLPALIHSSPYIGFKFVLQGWLKIAIQSENLVTSFEWWLHSGHFLYSHGVLEIPQQIKCFQPPLKYQQALKFCASLLIFLFQSF